MLKKVVSIVALGTMVFSSGVLAANIMFQDVPSGHWAEVGINWAAAAGLMQGDGTNFRPGDSVNRAELAVVMQRFNQYLDDKARVAAAPQEFMAVLSGDKGVPAVTTDATGTCDVILEGTTVYYTCTVEGLTVTAAHFHVGTSIGNGEVLHDIEFTGNTASGTWTDLTEAQVATLKAAGMYINVHTAANPDGEIRGQVTHVEVLTTP